MINEKEIDKLVVLVLVIALFVIAALILNKIIFAIFYGVLFAYVIFPIHKRLTLKIKNENVSIAIIMSLIVIILGIFVLIITTALINQSDTIMSALKNLDLTKIFKDNEFLSKGFASSAISSLNTYINNFVQGFDKRMTDFFLNIPYMLLHFIVMIATFFFVLKNGKYIVDSIKELSPFERSTTDRLIKRFKEVTNSILLGQVFVGILQGIVCGIGYFMFGVPNALLLTYITMIIGIIPVAGHTLVWIPAAVYLLMIGRTTAGLLFLIYGATIISAVEHLSRPIFISKKTEINTGIIITSMMGGLIAIGFSGIIIGPLVISYIILVFDIYKEKYADKKE